MDYSLVGKRIQHLRCQCGMSQSVLAELANVSPTYISHVECGNKKVSLGVLVRLADALGTTLDYLVGGHRNSQTACTDDAGAILSDCSPAERRIVLGVAEAVKNCLRNTDLVA